ncbi:MAG: glycine betaine ABC transporter substrate-binding protein, partial [Rhizobiaceae bacterium]
MSLTRSLAAALLAAGLSAGIATGAAYAGDSASCQAVRFADVGWTDIQATTATASVILDAIGYKPDTQVLSVPVTYQSLKNKDIDVFLG